MKDVGLLIAGAPMSRGQVRAIALTSLLAALDGFDILSVAFVAPSLAASWRLGPEQLGLLFSSGLIGMGLGSFLLAPVADSIGRRPVLLLSLAILAAGMFVSAFTGNLAQLAACRLVTGVGIGAVAALITPLAAEFTNLKYRSLAVALMGAGYPIGATVGGFSASRLLAVYDWPAVFLLGAAGALALLPAVLLWLPESPAFLIAKGGRRNEERLARILQRFDHPPTTWRMPPPRDVPENLAYSEIFKGRQKLATLQAALVNCLFIMTAYYILNWMPQLIVERGFSASAAASISAISSLAGSVACLLVGLLATRFPIRTVVAIVMTALGLLTALFEMIPASFGLLAMSAAVIGACLFGGTVGFYGIVVAEFEPRMRATGIGFVFGVGRASSALAPMFAGALLGFGFGRASVSVILGSAAILAGLLLSFRIRRAEETAI